jgi:histo-blood group ABO system transferase
MQRLFRFLQLSLVFIPFLCAHAAEDVAPQAKRAKVGLCIMATGRYDKFAQELIESARPFFCPNSDVTYFVFTDGKITPAKDVVTIFQKRLGWPHDTLKRFEVYDLHRKELGEMDYLFALDADMRFVATVGEEILGELVGTQHPGFVGKRGSYETNPMSTACIAAKEGEIYFAGGFYGGKREEFFKLIHQTREQIAKDEAKNFIAVWHDESHLNRYFIDHKPTLVLSPAYCYPENWKLPYEKKLLALDKNHAEMRKP